MYRILIIALVLSLQACAQQPTIDTAALQEAAKFAQRVYLSCMDAAAQVYATSPITPTEAGIAASGRCSAEFTKFDIATRNYMVGSVASERWKLIAAERADTLLADTKKKAQDSVVSKVVEQRMSPPNSRPGEGDRKQDGKQI